MDPNKLTLNPGADISGKLVCSHCGEEIVEVATDKENRFECGCEEIVEFDIPTEDHTTEKTDSSIVDSSDISETYDCPMCRGTGVQSVYLGEVGGTVECDNCDGTGKI